MVVLLLRIPEKTGNHEKSAPRPFKNLLQVETTQILDLFYGENVAKQWKSMHFHEKHQNPKVHFRNPCNKLENIL